MCDTDALRRSSGTHCFAADLRHPFAIAFGISSLACLKLSCLKVQNRAHMHLHRNVVWHHAAAHTGSDTQTAGFKHALPVLSCASCTALQVCIVQYDAANNRLATVASWVHPAEVWDVACWPGQPHRFVTVHSTGKHQ